MQTEATSSSHGTSDTLAAEKSKLELELEDAVENGFELQKGIGLRFQRAHAPITAKHAEYKAVKSHQQKAQFRLDWASQELRNLKQKKNTAKATKTWTGSSASACVSLRWWRSSATPATPRARPGAQMFALESATRWAGHGCHGMP